MGESRQQFIGSDACLYSSINLNYPQLLIVNDELKSIKVVGWAAMCIVARDGKCFALWLLALHACPKREQPFLKYIGKIHLISAKTKKVKLKVKLIGIGLCLDFRFN